MEWRDEGIILGTRRHGETSAILEVMTRAHGRHLGLVRGGRSRKQQPVLQAGTEAQKDRWVRDLVARRGYASLCFTEEDRSGSNSGRG